MIMKAEGKDAWGPWRVADSESQQHPATKPTALDIEKDAVGSGVPFFVCDILTAQNDSYKHVLECFKEGSPLKNF